MKGFSKVVDFIQHSGNESYYANYKKYTHDVLSRVIVMAIVAYIPIHRVKPRLMFDYYFPLPCLLTHLNTSHLLVSQLNPVKPAAHVHV